MIDRIGFKGVHAEPKAALRQQRAQETERAQESSAKTGKVPGHSAHSQGQVPPGLARAAEKIASKIFARADTDANGTVTREELSSVHSRHARILASSDLFEAPAAGIASDGTTDSTAEGAGGKTELAAGSTTETTPAPAASAVSEAQLKEALTKFFYAKVGVTYTPPPTSSQQPEASEPISTTAPGDVTPILDEPNSEQTFTAAA
jgi:hypothetical protein